ncbi:MAG TPA: TIGR01777 family oxidoreductase [Acidimicrobiales bacterium]|nr:TIGR01777 family oxidoreductase [Acidimicrobiales bacterium]
MRALVTGASGFIGRALVARLASDGHTVERVVSGPAGPGEAAFDLDGRRIDASRLPGGSLEGFDAVFHLAGEPITPSRWTPAKRERIRASRIVTTDVLSRALAALDSPPAVLVSGSAIGYYGDRGDEILVEGSTAGTGMLAELCRAWEAATSPAKAGGIRVVNVRTGIVLGAGGGVLAKQVRIFRLGLGGPLGTGRSWMSWIALEDEVGALLHAVACTELQGPCNLTAPSPVRNAEFADALGEALHRPARLALPRAALVGAMGRTVADEVVLASQRVLPSRLEQTGYRFARPSVREALAVALGHAPIGASGAATAGEQR